MLAQNQRRVPAVTPYDGFLSHYWLAFLALLVVIALALSGTGFLANWQRAAPALPVTPAETPLQPPPIQAPSNDVPGQPLPANGRYAELWA